MRFHQQPLILALIMALRGCSHMMSAKNGGVQTPPPPLPPLSAKVRNWPTPHPPLVRKKSEISLPSLPPLSEIKF